MGWYGWSVASGDGSRPRSHMTGSNSTCRLLGRGRRGKFAARNGLSPPGPRLARTRWVQPAPRVLPAFFNQTRLMNIQRRSSRSPDAAQRLQRGYARLRRATGGVLLCRAASWTMLRILAEALACSPLQDALFDFTQSRKEGRAMTTFFRHYRQRGPVNALQMRLQC